jgi:hypothetical protein
MRGLIHAVVRLVERDTALYDELRALIERKVVAAPKPIRCRFVYNNGGHVAASGGGCVPRAIAIATGKPYREVYEALVAATHKYVRRWPRSMVAGWIKRSRGGRSFDPERGCYDTIYDSYLKSLGWQYTPTKDRNIHLRADELPSGRLIVRVHRHLVAVIDGAIHDTFDSGGAGRRPVYGYYTAGAP